MAQNKQARHKRESRINLQMTADEKEFYQFLAKDKGMNLSPYIRLVLSECGGVTACDIRRDKTDVKRLSRVNVQALASEKAAYKKAADTLGVSLSKYIRAALSKQVDNLSDVE